MWSFPKSRRDFVSDAQAGLFVGRIHHTVALIGKRRLGKGLVLISTFRLLKHITADAQHPVATIMLHDLIQHLVRAPIRQTGTSDAIMSNVT